MNSPSFPYARVLTIAAKDLLISILKCIIFWELTYLVALRLLIHHYGYTHNINTHTYTCTHALFYHGVSESENAVPTKDPPTLPSNDWRKIEVLVVASSWHRFVLR